MGGISKEHAEWAVVDRLRQMLESPTGDFTATQSFALFSSIVCWVMQHVRIKEGQVVSIGDQAAQVLWEKFKNEPIADAPWSFTTASEARSVQVGTRNVMVPSAPDFSTHTADRFFKNLRDAMAHGDARNVEPFNDDGWLVGFTFNCSERPINNVAWKGRITLLRADMQTLGRLLATRYCDAIKQAQGDDQAHFEHVASTIPEEAEAA